MPIKVKLFGITRVAIFCLLQSANELDARELVPKSYIKNNAIAANFFVIIIFMKMFVPVLNLFRQLTLTALIIFSLALTLTAQIF